MKHRIATMLMLLPVLLVFGCASQQQAVVDEEISPLHVQYDIQYVDYSSVGVELMVISPELPHAVGDIERDLFEVFNAVAQTVPRDVILSQQSEFRDALNNAFAASSEYGPSSRVLVTRLSEGSWVAQR